MGKLDGKIACVWASGGAIGSACTCATGRSSCTCSSLPRVGAIVVPVNHFLSPREVTYALDHSGAMVVVTDGEFDEVIAEVAPNLGVEHWVTTLPEVTGERPDPIEVAISLDDPVVILYTSGTTASDHLRN
jgi:acyl-CoA synthetase (AMP-forming)/AMP-acid ligase II